MDGFKAWQLGKVSEEKRVPHQMHFSLCKLKLDLLDLEDLLGLLDHMGLKVFKD